MRAARALMATSTTCWLSPGIKMYVNLKDFKIVSDLEAPTCSS